MTRPVRPGLPFYGTATGIAILDSGIPRPVGDVGNARSFSFPVRYQVVDGIHPADMSAPRTSRVADGFVSAIEQLAKDGIRVAGSSCGLLAQYQEEVAARSPIPVALSSLLQIPLALRVLRPDQSVLLVTIRSTGVGQRHLLESGIDPKDRDRVIIGDLPDAAHFRAAIAGQVDSYDVDQARQEVIAGVRRHLPEGHHVGAVVLECTNLAPFAADLRVELGLPVWDVITLLTWLNGAVASD